MSGFLDDIFKGVNDVFSSVTSPLASIFTGQNGSGGLFSFFDKLPPGTAGPSIIAATSLLSNIFGSDLDEDTARLARDKFEYEKTLNDANLALNREELAQRKELAEAQIAASLEAAGIAAGTQKAIANQRTQLERLGLKLSSNQNIGALKAQNRAKKAEMTQRHGENLGTLALATGEAGRKGFADTISGIVGALK